MKKNSKTKTEQNKDNFDYSKIKRKPWLQKVVDENGPVLTRNDRIDNSPKYQDWLSMPSDEWSEKYSKNIS